MLQYLTAGESHGQALTVILVGLPAHLPIQADEINRELARRQRGYGRGARMKIEQDRVEILSGIRAGKTIGSPICLKIPNRDWDNWKSIMDVAQDDQGQSRIVHHPRPGHADLGGGMKYDHHDLRNVLERASARETAARVAAGSIARKLLAVLGIDIVGHVISLGGIEVSRKKFTLRETRRRSESSELRCADSTAEARMIQKINEAKRQGDSLGGVLEVVAEGLPPGLGSHIQWDRRLDGKIAQAIMSIQAIKGVEIGMGFESARRFGSQVHDEILYDKKKGYTRARNHAGGLEGGMTNGEPVVVRAAMKPLSTLMRPLRSVNIISKDPHQATVERSDVTAVPAAAVIAENVLALVLADSLLEKFGSDSMRELQRNWKGYWRQIRDY